MLPTMGMRVIIARPELRPTEFADSHLFVHKDKPSLPLPRCRAVETAQTVAPGTKTDVIDPPAGHVAKAPPTTGPKTDGVAQNAEQPRPVEPTPAEIVKGAETAATQPGKPPETTAVEPAKTTATLTKPSEPAPTAPGKGGTTEASAPGAPATPTLTVPTEAASVATTPADITAPISVDDVPLPLSKPAQLARTAAGRSRSSSAARPTRSMCGRISRRCSTLRSLSRIPINRLAPTSSRRWIICPTIRPSAGPSSRFPARRRKGWSTGNTSRTPTVIAGGCAWRNGSASRRRPPETPQQALARIEIPQDVIDQISQLIVPGSSLVVSDQGLGPETGSGTDFIVVTR